MEERIRLRLQNAGVPSDMATIYATRLVQEGCNTFKLMSTLTRADLVDFAVKPEHVPLVEHAVAKIKAMGTQQQALLTQGTELPFNSVSPAILAERIGNSGVPDKMAEEIAHKLFFELGYQSVRQFKQLTEAMVRDKFMVSEEGMQAIMSIVAAANVDITKPAELKSSKMDAHSSAILSIAVWNDPKFPTVIFSVGADCNLKMWIMEQDHFSTVPAASFPHGGWVWDVAACADMVATACDDGTLHLFSRSSSSSSSSSLTPMGILTLPETLTPKSDSIRAVCIAPDAKRVACGSKLGIVALFDVSNSGGGATPLKTYVAHRGNAISRMCFSPSDASLIASSSFDCSMSVWNTDAAAGMGSSVLVLSGHQCPIRGFCYVLDAKYIVTCSDDASIRLWNVAGKCVDQQTYTAQNATVTMVGMVSKDLLCSGGSDGSIRLWAFKKGKDDMTLSLFKLIQNGHVGGIWGTVPVITSNHKPATANKVEFITCSTDRELRWWSVVATG